MGKTEAALWASYYLLCDSHASRQQSNVSALFRVCPAHLSGNGDRAAHSRQILVAVETQGGLPAGGGENAGVCWFNTSRRSLFTPFGVGTVEQAVLEVLAVRYFTLRRFALAGKVVTVDEVHLHDMDTGTLILQLRRELEALECMVIILSATL